MAANKALTQSDIANRAQRWASVRKQLDALEAERDKKLAPINKKYDELAEPLRKKVDAFDAEIRDWLDKQKKSLSIESKHAIAELVIASKQGDRQPDVDKLKALCKSKKVPFDALLAIVLKKADELLGKKEVDAISVRPMVPTRTTSLRLKD